jgi:hypothetical protein
MRSNASAEIRRGVRRVLPAVAALAFAAPAFSQYLVVRTDPAGKITYESYEEVTINGQARLRTPSGIAATFDANSYKLTGKVNLAEAGLLRRSAGTLVQLSDSGTRTLVLPDQIKLLKAATPAEIWKGTAIGVKKLKKDKDSVTLGLHQVLAILPGASPAASAAAFVTAPGSFDGIGEQGAALIAAAAAFRASPEAGSILAYLSRLLRDGFDRLEAAGPYSEFLKTVQYAQFAQKAFPEDQGVTRLAGTILGKRDWVDETTLMLESLIDGRNWDTYLERYPVFEKYQDSFPGLAAARRTAYEESARFHSAAGRSLMAHQSYGEALAQLRLAQARDPGNKPLEALAESARIEAAHATAAERTRERRGPAEGSANATLLNRRLGEAALSIDEKRFQDALDSLAAAEELDRSSPRLLYMRARYFQATSQFAKALQMLDAYDESVTGTEDLKAGEDLRIPVAHALQNLRNDNTARLDQLLASGRYWDAQALAAQSLASDPQYVEFLYRAGIVAAVLRNKDAAGLLEGYLRRSDSLRGDAPARARANRLLAYLREQSQPAEPAAGKPNWFSAKPLPQGAFYCPLSLAFQARIESIRARKMTVKFEWGPSGRLQRISTAFDDARAKQDYLAHLTRRMSDFPALYFGYRPEIAPVFRVAEGTSAPPVPAGLPMLRRDGKGLAFIGESPAPADGGWSYPVLPNHPLVDRGAVALLDSEIAMTVAGNSYFNPFVWDGLHVFRLRYDSLGRAAEAREAGVPSVIRFEWRNHQLMSVTAFDITDPKAERQTYKRSMAYEGDLLVTENVEYGGKSYKITYGYQGDKLLSASFTDNGAHDGSERKIKFVLP